MFSIGHTYDLSILLDLCDTNTQCKNPDLFGIATMGAENEYQLLFGFMFSCIFCRTLWARINKTTTWSTAVPLILIWQVKSWQIWIPHIC